MKRPMPQVPKSKPVPEKVPIAVEKPVHLSKRQELTDLLRRRIATLHTGQRMPSVRALMKRFALSMQTVTAALGQLEVEKLIVSRPGSGTYVSDSQAEKLIVMHRTYHPSYHQDLRDNAVREAVARAGWRLVTRRHDAKPDDHPALLAEPLAAAHLVSQDMAYLRPDIVDDLLAQKVPVVALEQTIEDRPVLDSILQDDRQHEAQMMKHFASLGHRRVGAVLNEPDYLERENADTVLQRVQSRFGIRLTMVDCGTKPGQSSAEMAYLTMKRYLSEHRRKLPFSAICVTSSPGGVGVLRALHEEGIKVPRQCSVASFGYQTSNHLHIPSLTEVGVPSELWGDSVVQLLQKRFSSHDLAPISMQVESRVFARESTAKCPSARAGKKPMRRRSP